MSSLAVGGVEARAAAGVAGRLASRAAPALIGGPLGFALGAALLAYGAYELYQMYNKSHLETSEEEPGECTGECPSAAPEFADQNQDGDVKGTPQNKNREKQGKPTSTFDGDRRKPMT